ncbi:MAG: hypothetical protein ABIT04_11830 [Novosphingobium sp.]
MAGIGTSCLTISELREFASFAAREQRYIRRALDIGLGRQDAVKLWARDEAEAEAIGAQYIAYRTVKTLREAAQAVRSVDFCADFLGSLIALTAFDLAQERLASFSAYRFLYERLIDVRTRPWLPAAFCAASALPQIRPERRKLLLRSISEAAATATGWSTREPCFYPEWVDEVAESP